MSESIENLGYKGKVFQLKLLKEIIYSSDSDTKGENFGEETLDHLLTSYFEDESLKKFYIIVKNYFDKYKKIPNPDNIEQEINTKISDELDKEAAKSVLKKIIDLRVKIQNNEVNNDSKYIRDTTWEFIRQQEFKKVTDEAKSLLEAGKLDAADHIAELFKKALDIGSNENFGISVTNTSDDSFLSDMLENDARDIVPTGIPKLDGIMNGGLGKGQMGMVLAGQGVGKTSLLSLLANNACLAGKNVLHVIFEDTEKDIFRKHIAKWTKFRINDLVNFWKSNEGKKQIKEKLELHNQKHAATKGRLEVVRFASERMTIPKLETFMNKLEKKLGITFEVLVADYIDCFESHKRTGISTWDSQMDVAKALESMTAEKNIATWTGVQGKKESTDKRLLTMNDCGGSVEKLKKAHFIISIGRDIDQKNEKKANIAILKSRFSDDGYVWEDIILDNSRLIIDLSTAIADNITDLQMQEEFAVPKTNSEFTQKAPDSPNENEDLKMKKGIIGKMNFDEDTSNE